MIPLPKGVSCALAASVCVVFAWGDQAVFAQTNGVTFDDHQNMMEQLGVKSLRPGPDPNNQATFDELLGQPAKRDHAPSPTGDPSAR